MLPRYVPHVVARWRTTFPVSTLWARKGPERLTAALNGRPGDVIRTAVAVAERTGATVAQVALHWVMTHPEISVVITGADTAEHLDDNLGSVGLRLSIEDVAEFDRVSEGMSLVGW